jgi:MFS superfamily sulfate permease-like transporter
MSVHSRWLAHWRGDLAGGVTSAILTIPVSMGYGILALYALGDQYVSYGILAGLYGAIFVPATAVLLGADTAMMYAPRSVVTFLLGAIVSQSLVKSGTDGVDLADVHQTLVLVFFVVLMAGLFQAGFGAFRLGSLVQYIPSPVMAGFQNAAAILIFLSQIDSLLGFRRHVPLPEIVSHAGAIQPLTLLVGLLTAVAMWQVPKLTRKLPLAIAGLIAGSAGYYLLVAMGFRSQLGPVIGAMPSAVPSASYLFSLLSVPASAELRHLMPALITGALSLAIIASLDGLLCAKTIEGATGQKVRGNHELVRLGLGNMVAACFGGIASGVNLGSSFANHKAGGRTSASVLVTAVFILIAVLLLTPVIAYIPRAVIAGLLVVVSLQLIDRWSLQILRRMLAREFVYWRNMTVDLIVILLVATVAIAANLVAAVGIGVGVAVLSFLTRMSKSLVRRAYHGDVIHSRRTRDPMIHPRKRRIRADKRDQSCDQQYQARRRRQICERLRGALHLRAERALHRLQHRVEVPSSVVAQAINIKCRRASDAGTPAIGDVPLDALQKIGALYISLKAIHIEPDGARDGRDRVAAKWRLVIEERIMHRPELILLARSFCGERGECGTGVSALIGEVPEHIDHAWAQGLA